LGSSAGTEIETGRAADRICAAFRRRGHASLFLDGSGGFAEAWGPFLAVEPKVRLSHRASRPEESREALVSLDRIVEKRRRKQGGSPATGIAALAGYDLLDRAPVPSRDDDGLPDLVLLEVDTSILFVPGGRPVLTVLEEGSPGTGRDAVRRKLDEIPDIPDPPQRFSPCGSLATSLDRSRYLEAVEKVKRHIRLGDIYQANLTQRFSATTTHDPFDVYRALVKATPAPRSAFVETDTFALASASPEVFLKAHPDGGIETRPIKGTRPRGSTAEEDDRATRELLASEKDRAELTMIVDLERNDLGRVCRTGSIGVPELCTLRSFAAVHHLVARVEGRLNPDTSPSELIRATFPGGSITGAPKIRAMEILRSLEPVRRGFYTGSLFWFGDDGSIDSSILIRSLVMTGGRVLIGAGGGVVADSDPEAEWRESNDKARALLGVFGLAPEEAV